MTALFLLVATALCRRAASSSVVGGARPPDAPSGFRRKKRTHLSFFCNLANSLSPDHYIRNHRKSIWVRFAGAESDGAESDETLRAVFPQQTPLSSAATACFSRPPSP